MHATTLKRCQLLLHAELLLLLLLLQHVLLQLHLQRRVDAGRRAHRAGRRRRLHGPTPRVLSERQRVAGPPSLWTAVCSGRSLLLRQELLHSRQLPCRHCRCRRLVGRGVRGCLVGRAGGVASGCGVRQGRARAWGSRLGKPGQRRGCEAGERAREAGRTVGTRAASET